LSASIKDIVVGRKTFFITPDNSLIPEDYLEEYFSLGYECYFIENDKQLSLDKKIEILISLFNDIILFFNIDYNIQDLYWPSFIKEILDKYKNKVLIGVLYNKRQSKDERAKLERKYLMDIGCQCGCIQIEYKKASNFEIIQKILYANQAQGRRKNIRAICSKTCTFSFTKNKYTYTGRLQDISISHFSFVFPAEKVDIADYEKISDFHFSISGFMFRSDAVLIMKRATEEGLLYVFAFVTEKGLNGLDDRNKQLLSPNIYKLMVQNCKDLLNQVYLKVAERNAPLDELETLYSD